MEVKNIKIYNFDKYIRWWLKLPSFLLKSIDLYKTTYYNIIKINKQEE